jgi:hypothetical protein
MSLPAGISETLWQRMSLMKISPSGVMMAS